MLGSAAALSDGLPHRHQTGRPAASHAEPHEATVLRLPARGNGAEAAGRPIELNLLGGFRLTIGGSLTHIGKTGERLLAALATRGRQATRSQIAHTLWPDTTTTRAHANLRTALYRLYRRAPTTLHATTTHLQLPAGIHIDLEHTTRLANHVLTTAGNRQSAPTDDADHELFNDALQANLYDDLLPDWDDPWLTDTQYRYRQLRLAALEQLSTHLARTGHYGGAIQAALAAVQADPLRDSAHEILIRTCLAQGNRHQALTHYNNYRRILRDELGLEPPQAINDLLNAA